MDFSLHTGMKIFIHRYDDKYMREDNIQGFTISLQKTIAFILFEVELSKKGKYLSYLCKTAMVWVYFLCSFQTHFRAGIYKRYRRNNKDLQNLDSFGEV